MDKISLHKTGNLCINVTLWRVRLTVVAVEKEYVLHILSMSVAMVIQHALRMRRIVSSVACPVVPYFFKYLINGLIFG
jgi:hypothetical protein